MDEVSRAYYELAFRAVFSEKRGNDFQGFFSSIMEMRYPGDFMRVRPWGKQGDRKNDGYLPSKRILFQSYAPNEIAAAECIKKIDEDFNGALDYWSEYFDVWVFVHNSRDGLGPEVTKKLLALAEKHAPLKVIPWGFPELRLEAMALTEANMASLFGPAPSRRTIIEMELKDLVPLLDHISRLPPVPDADLRPVPADKLQRNLLSESVATLLRAGMSRATLVRKYFRLKATLKDELAEAFRRKYEEFRNSGMSPDDIFSALQRFAGGSIVPSPSQQSAVLACMAFFFEECDIFERVDEPAERTS